MAKRSDSRILETTAAVMVELGGPAKVAALTGADYKTVWPWERMATFPSRYFFLMTQELRQRGFSAPPELWGQVMPADGLLPASSKRRAA